MTAQRDDRVPDLADPAFRARIAEHVGRDEAEFRAWVAEDNFGPLIDRALDKGKMEFAASASWPEEENPRWTLVVIELDHPRAKPLVQALAGRGIGEVDLTSYTYDISFRHVMGKRKAVTSRQQHATLEAFALALSKPGFELQVWRE